MKIKPFWKFISCTFHDYRRTEEYIKGIRTILSIRYDISIMRCIDDDYQWICPLKHIKITFIWVICNIFIPWGRIVQTEYGITEEKDLDEIY